MGPAEQRTILLVVGVAVNTVAAATAANLTWNDDPGCGMRAIGHDHGDGGMLEDRIQLELKVPDKYGVGGGWRNPLHTDVYLLVFLWRRSSEKGGDNEYRHPHRPSSYIILGYR